MLSIRKQNNGVIKFFRQILIFILLLSNFALFASKSKADAGDDLVNTLENMTCATQGIGDLLRSEFAHTCVSTSFFDGAIHTIITGGNYVNAVLRLKIRDNELFPGSGCGRENRINPADLKISYAMCSDSKLAGERAKFAGESAVNIAVNAYQGNNLFEDLGKIDYEDYHIKRTDKRIGFSENFIDVVGLSFIPLEVRRDRDMMCVATKTLWGSLINVGCQYIAEPYPTSVHGDFFGKENGDSQFMSTDTSIASCRQESCYTRSYKNSKTALPMTGGVAECVREMSNRLLVAEDACVATDVSQNTTFLFAFQQNMQRAITLLLSIYVVISGLIIILKGDLPGKSEMINMILKIVLVTYFSVGINDSDGQRFDGISELVMPFLLSGIGELAAWIINASPSELCSFDSSLYSPGYQHLALWDSVDCRISHYLGLDMIGSMYSENQDLLDDGVSGIIDNLSFPLPPYFYFLPPALYTGNISLVMLVLAYPLMVISVVAYLVNIFAASIISITILAFLAPLFVPFYLFEYTRKYFDQWAKLLFSFMLQPMMVAAFMIAFFSVIDFGIYGKCQYKSQSFDFAGRSNIRYFYLNDNWDDYDSPEDIESCEKSLGYILNNRLLSAVVDLSPKAHIVKGVTELAEGSNFGEMMEKRSGAFFNSFNVIFDLVRDFMLATLIATFILYLMKNLSEQLSNFVADMVEGVPLNSVTINPMSLYDGANKIARKINAARSGGGSPGNLSPDMAAGSAVRSSDLAGGGVARSSDMAAAGNARSSDMASAGAGTSSSPAPSGGSVQTSQPVTTVDSPVSGSIPASDGSTQITEPSPANAPETGQSDDADTQSANQSQNPGKIAPTFAGNLSPSNPQTDDDDNSQKRGRSKDQAYVDTSKPVPEADIPKAQRKNYTSNPEQEDDLDKENTPQESKKDGDKN